MTAQQLTGLTAPWPSCLLAVPSLGWSTSSQLGGHCAAKVKEGGLGRGEGPADRCGQQAPAVPTPRRGPRWAVGELQC